MKKQLQKKSKIEIEQLNDLPKKETFENLHEAKPVTRRDLLATGLIGFSASMVLPSALTLLAPERALAADPICGVVGGGNMSVYINVKGSGGMAISANALPLDKGGQLLASYSKMGGGTGGAVPVAYEFANRAPFLATSGILNGIRARASTLTLANSNFCANWYRSQDDSANNKIDITGLVQSSGVKGSILPGLGRTGEVGVSNQFAYTRPSAPLLVGNFNDIVGSLGVSGSLAALSATQKGNMFHSIQSLTAGQSASIDGMTGGETLSRLLGCANQTNTNLIANTSSLNIDPLTNAAFSAVWGINANTNKGSQDFVFASMVYNACNGNASTVNLEVGGCDYHDMTRTSGDTKDLEIGTVLGNVLQSLAVMGKKGFVTCSTDGAVTSPDSDIPGAVWASDRGVASGSYMMSYDPVGPHIMKGFQVGHYTSGQAADDLFLTGGNTELAAAASFVNYMSFNGKLGLVESYLPRVFTTDELDLITKFT